MEIAYWCIGKKTRYNYYSSCMIVIFQIVNRTKASPNVSPTYLWWGLNTLIALSFCLLAVLFAVKCRKSVPIAVYLTGWVVEVGWLLAHTLEGLLSALSKPIFVITLKIQDSFCSIFLRCSRFARFALCLWSGLRNDVSLQ